MCVTGEGNVRGDEDNGGEDNGDAGRRRRRLRIAGFALAGVLVLAASGLGWTFWRLNSNIKGVDINTALGDDRPARTTATAAPEASATTDSLPSGTLNILVLGSDSRSGKENAALGGGDEGAGARSDTAMVVHVDEGRTGATVVSIPRDTLVTRPSCPLESGGSTAVAYNAMFNSAYAVGGPVCAVKTVESMTGVRMDHYMEIDFAGFAKLVDALGGVTVTTDEDIDDADSHLKLAAGTHHLDGEQALALARTRHGIGDGSDLGRIGLQQKLVKALLDQISSTDLLTNPAQLYRAADAVTASLTTDTGLASITDLVRLGRSLEGLSSAATTTVMMPVAPAPYDSNRVVAREPEARKLWESLK
ncbi:LCP family protein [Streptomyces scabiei]|uniref:LCP family protein n=1 Tax=Streptomyces TaxID=1883 RepID=UPI0005A02AD8|nr:MULTISPECIES: LCP family protein [Streptomyces]MBP5869343.1 LytR family transcriptional regulator [Streptomyces sp. LBUM 1485]MBP5891510.1 LytR family transcriptional regulator [Streptomyces sp. LBUM 1481]MBP5914722.1 LytR family transcriptional regulator [Streptomyces sp. LBUM 1486]MBP5921665.1 LytR family transcriptional regulator [Streptomyces sp. LBUM 1483]MDX2578462.1 LCP family protein [Streptomyces scabiei]